MNKFYRSLTIEQLQEQHKKVKREYIYAVVPEFKMEWRRILRLIEDELEKQRRENE